MYELFSQFWCFQLLFKLNKICVHYNFKTNQYLIFFSSSIIKEVLITPCFIQLLFYYYFLNLLCLFIFSKQCVHFMSIILTKIANTNHYIS